MSEELDKIIAITSNDTVKKSDAVIWLEGDALFRKAEVLRVYQAGLADCIVVSGGVNDPQRPNAIPATKLAEELYKEGIPKEKVIVEAVSQNTFAQGVEVMKIVAGRGWQKIILVASLYHQLRAYLTFLQAMKNAGLKIKIYNSPARDRNSKELFADELKKVEAYRAKGHIYPLEDALKYQAWKETQSYDNYMDIAIAKKIMGKNFIGPDELKAISAKLGIAVPVKSRIPRIPFTEEVLKKNRHNAVLILGAKLTINDLRARFGINPKYKPCFYNQDWYLKEDFAAKRSLRAQWYLVSKNITSGTRGQDPGQIKKSLTRIYNFPSAVLAAFTFFAYYFHTKGEILWPHDFIWCSDKDKNGDQIYVGCYPFNIHRHLQIRSCYGLAPQIL
ncbi:MAG: YdcF family protein [Patescibacteria group bacterium]